MTILKNQKIIFTTTIFISAYLLFLIQPMVGKVLLPLLGGTPSIWNTAMVFFQVLLLAGYLYAHMLSKLKSVKTQIYIHGTILLCAFLTLPMATLFTPPEDDFSPLTWQITTMIGMIGLPFFVLSTSAPLLQRWFSLSDHPNAHNPYFLYAASNVGSILALVLYPLLVERFLPLQHQSTGFQIGFAILAISIVLCGLSIRKSIIHTSPTETHIPQPSIKTMATWLLLAFVPSSLMLGYTSFVTTDIGSAPLFWVIPLILYILSFIIAFSSRPIITLKVSSALFIVFFLFANIAVNYFLGSHLWQAAIIHGFLFFLAALMCHQMLEKLKPNTQHLTLFFLIMSLGGALGGVFNSLIAPLIFLKPYEYMLALALAAVCWGMHGQKRFFVPLLILLMLMNPAPPWEEQGKKLIYLSRNYFGTLAVREIDGLRTLSHGSTIHGAQTIDQKFKTTPVTYYYKKTAIAQTFDIIKKHNKHAKVTVLGLGAGVASCLLRPQDNLTYFEIDPDVIKVATDKNLFTYISDCNTPVKIIQGDARLKLQKEQNQNYDLVFADAFSGDNVPVHLINVDATRMYLEKMKPDGIVAFHISNRYLDLKPEVGLIAKSLGINAYFKFSEAGKVEGTNLPYYPTLMVVLTHNPVYAKDLMAKGWTLIDVTNNKNRPWSDTYANPLRTLISRDFTSSK